VRGRYVLAEGEASGHAHTIDGRGVEVFKLAAGGEGPHMLFVKARRAFVVCHQEHRAVTIPAGTWVIDRVREYDHFAEESREVVD
jgi:hypothetical protein